MYPPRTNVVNIHKAPYDVYIGRAGHGQDGYFGNPYKLYDESRRLEVVLSYEEWFRFRLHIDPTFRQRVHALKGKTLGCFCKPQICHGDVIADYLNWEVR